MIVDKTDSDHTDVSSLTLTEVEKLKKTMVPRTKYDELMESHRVLLENHRVLKESQKSDILETKETIQRLTTLINQRGVEILELVAANKNLTYQI